MAVDEFRELDDVFLQSQARIWIGEVLHTRLDEQLSISDLLSDGELLFEVSKTLWNMLLIKYMELKSHKARMFVPVDTRKGSGRYRPYSNVDSFLKVCKVMGLSGVDLFSPSDVVEKRNTRKVCVCIRSLSAKARSKQLNVPDFDIVINTVAMSTDVVRCIRRSLELSSLSAGQSKHARLKSRQKTSSASYKQEDESCVEESDDAKSHFSDTSYLDFLYLESESPDTVDKYALTQSVQLDKFAHTPRSVLLQYVNSENQLDETLSNFCESIFDECTSQNMGEVSHHISVSDMISFRIVTNATFHDSCMATESHSSNTTPDPSISRVWRKLPEASPTSSVLGRVLDFDFDAKSEPDDLTTLESGTYDKMLGPCNQSELHVLADSFSAWRDDTKSVDQDLEHVNKNKKDLVLVKDDVTNIANSMQGKGSTDKLMKMADPKPTHNVAGVKSSGGCAEDTSKAASKDERTYANEKSEKRASYVAPLLKTVAKGTALIGILFFLHLRIRPEKSIQLHWKSNGAGYIKRKEEKVGKIYPAENFKFDD